MSGKVTRVFLLHGLGTDRRAFERFERLLPREWNVTAIDLLGHGAAPKPAAGYSLDDHAAFVAAVIARELGLWSADDAPAGEPPIVLGHSYGAAIGVALAALYPHLVGALVLLDPVVDPHRHAQVTGAMSGAAAARRGGSDGEVHEKLEEGRDGLERLMQARRDGQLAAIIDELFAHESEALRRWVVETWMRMAIGVIDELDTDWPRFAERLRCPVTVVHGDVEAGSGGDLAVSYLNSPRVVHIEGAGHFIHATHARQTAVAVVEAVEATAGVS